MMRIAVLRRTHRWIILLVLFGLVATSLGYGWSRGWFVRYKVVELSNPNVQISYPRALKLTPAKSDEAENRNVQTLFRASDDSQDNPLVIRLNKETGLRIVTSLGHTDLISGLSRNLERAYPSRFPEFEKVSERTSDYQGKKAAELYFKYKSPAGIKITQRLMLIEYDPDTALFLSAQAREQDFDSLNRRYFNRVFESLSFH